MPAPEPNVAVNPSWPCSTELRDLARAQAGVVSRDQAMRLGLTPDVVRAAVKARRWQRIHRGVYALFTSPLPEPSRVWAGLLWAGNGAALAGPTAIRQYGVNLADPDGRIHLLVDHERRIGSTDSVRVTRRRDLQRFVHPVRQPPTLRLEDAVLHHAANGPEVAAGLGLLADACQSRRTTPDRLHAALLDLPALRNRQIWAAVLDDVATGAHSFLEISYLRRVERAHGLPTP